MFERIESVTEVLMQVAEGKRQFLNSEDGWMAFLVYLHERRGADIHRVRGMEEISAAWNYVANGYLRKSPDDNDPAAAWFDEFDRRQDVCEAFRKFAKERGLEIHEGTLVR